VQFRIHPTDGLPNEWRFEIIVAEQEGRILVFQTSRSVDQRGEGAEQGSGENLRLTCDQLVSSALEASLSIGNSATIARAAASSER
jgi:hypothetical protein